VSLRARGEKVEVGFLRAALEPSPSQLGGGIHKYVGDEVIATSRLQPGPNPPACVSALFAARDRIAAQEPAYERDFGAVPDFRASLHCGPVAVGEFGSLRTEIVLIGDTMNTAARILEACRSTGHRTSPPRPSSIASRRCLPASRG
jgi:class 3 adenylate cyclase